MHIRYEGRVPLTEADEHPPFSRYVFDRQPGPAPIMPLGSGQRFQPALRLHAADARKIIAQSSELDVELLRVADVLQRATATAAKYGATRFDALRGRLEHVE